RAAPRASARRASRRRRIARARTAAHAAGAAVAITSRWRRALPRGPRACSPAEREYHTSVKQISRTTLNRATNTEQGLMSFSLLDSRGCPLEKQRFTWRDLVQKPISKLDDDAFTRVRIILLNGIELEAHRFSHSCARMNKTL